MVGFLAVEHPHRCVYCANVWFCHEDCPLAGPSVCAECHEKLLVAPPETPLRVIALERGSRVLDCLAEYDAARITRQLKRRDRPQ